jgi:cell division septation protein DedD
MGFEPAPLSCPLCKRRLPERTVGQAPGTRLCEQCQTIVITAFRGSIRTLETLSVVGHDQATVPTPGEQVLEEDLLIGEKECVDDVSPEISSPVSNVSVSQFSTFETSEDSSFRFFEEEEPQYRVHREDTESANDHYEASLYSEKSLSQFDETDSRPEAESVTEISKAAEDTASPEAGGILESPASLPVLNRDNQRDQEFEQEPVTGVITADPWEEPLPAWDYSQNEWPVLIGPHKRTVPRERAAIASLVILLVLVLFYLMVYRPANAERRTTDNEIQTGAEERSASSAAREEQKQTAQLSSDNNSHSTSAANETVASQSVYENKNGLGKFSLQAAAFPTEAGANEFAEKLKGAGVPSYVVSADVARRGRWFRVRVGRFNSADEAQRFAGEAQLRARTTGLALQLIVCQYEQP